jgi:nitrile hydratase accessory protein
MKVETLLKTPGIPKEDDGPVFAAPHEAKIFAIVVQLSERGLFDWKEWADTFSAEIAEAEKTSYEPNRDYYPCWMRALEKLLTERDLLSKPMMEEAVQNTIDNWPHPDHVAQRKPVGISAASSRN